MQVNERRRLLENIDILVRKPSRATGTTAVEVLNDISALFSELCGRKVVLIPVCANIEGNQEKSDNFKETVQGTNPEQ